MGLRTAVSQKWIVGLRVIFGMFILLYFAVGFYFVVNGLLLSSGGSVLIGLACWGGMALFMTPLWLVVESRTQTDLLRYQNQLLRVLVEDSSRNHDVSPSVH